MTEPLSFTDEGTLQQSKRCPMAIKFGVTLHTRCRLDARHNTFSSTAMRQHEGRGLEHYPEQAIHWLPGDRREYETDRTDEYSWEGQ